MATTPYGTNYRSFPRGIDLFKDRSFIVRTQKLLHKMIMHTSLYIIWMVVLSGVTIAQTETFVRDIVGYTLDSDTTYIIDDGDDEFHITSGTLTIPTGTTIKFASGNSMVIDADATLRADSIATFTSYEAGGDTAGHWGSIIFEGEENSEATGVFGYCIFEYGGENATDDRLIICDDYSDVIVENCTFRYNNGWVLKSVLQDAHRIEFTDNVVHHCAGAGFILFLFNRLVRISPVLRNIDTYRIRFILNPEFCA